MNHITVLIPEDLALDMAGSLDELLKIDLVLAEGRHGFALGLGHLAGKISGAADHAHAAPASPQEALSMTG